MAVNKKKKKKIKKQMLKKNKQLLNNNKRLREIKMKNIDNKLKAGNGNKRKTFR